MLKARLFFFMTLLLSLVACGGGSSSGQNDSGSASQVEAQLEDSEESLSWGDGAWDQTRWD